jgi:formyltetrahydrofolate synthetase
MAAQDVASYTVSGGVVTALTKDSGKRFYKYELVKATSSFVENINASVENGTIFYQQELTIVLNKLQANTRNEILLLAKNTLMAVVQDANDKYWLLGRYTGLDVTGGTSATGTAQGDRNGYTLTFTGGEKELAPEVNSGIIAGLVS